MAITLRVSSFQNQHLGRESTRVFETGGSIGRLSRADWVLPDPDRFISGEHARILKRGSDYVLMDVSSNGTQLNGRRIPRNSEHPLANGDEIGIGDYTISVTIDEPVSGRPTVAGDPAGAPPWSPPMGGGGASVDPLEVLGGHNPGANSSPSVGAQSDHVPPDQQFFEPEPLVPDPGVTDAEESIPERWWEEDESQPSSEHANAPPKSSRPPRPDPGSASRPKPFHEHSAGSADEGLDTFLRSAGLDPSEVNDEVRAAMGQVLRLAVQGMVELLQSRAEFKNQFRVARTTLQSTDNNPLKVSANAEDALFNMFMKPIPGFQDAAEAFQEGIDDLRAHQVAVMAGMKAGFRAVMSHFDPERLEDRFDRGLKRGRLLDVVNKTKYWELYREEYSSYGNEDAAFKKLFAEEFGAAYEQQMHRLTSIRNRNRR